MVRLPEWPVERLAEARILSDLPSPGERFRLSRVGAPGCNLGSMVGPDDRRSVRPAFTRSGSRAEPDFRPEPSPSQHITTRRCFPTIVIQIPTPVQSSDRPWKQYYRPIVRHMIRHSTMAILIVVS